MNTLNRILFDIALALAIICGLTWLDNWTAEREARVTCESKTVAVQMPETARTGGERSPPYSSALAPAPIAHRTLMVMADTNMIIRCDRRMPVVTAKGKR